MQADLTQLKPQEVTQLIAKASAGDALALNDLIPLVYDDLKRIASGIRHKQMAVSKTLNTTSLVNEAWLKLQKWGIQAESRKHFFCITAKAMRQILINAANEKLTAKRKGQLVTFDDHSIEHSDEAEWMLMLDQILLPIEKQQPRMAQVFQLKYFLGFTEPEIAEVMVISLSTVSRDWLTVKKIISNILT
jgi:RNA polymerase sigma factor (TIGR02999 family)